MRIPTCCLNYLSLYTNDSFCLDKNDKGEESEEEIWAETPSTSKTASNNNSSMASVDQDSDDYGGSTDVDDPDTEDEIEM